MRCYPVFIFIGFVAAAPAALACSPPAFPVPDEVALVQLKVKDGAALEASEEFLARSYEKDRGRYLDVYNQIFPCSFYGDKQAEAEMPEDQKAVLKQELLLLERKWNQQGTTAENIAGQEEFIDIAPGEFYAME